MVFRYTLSMVSSINASYLLQSSLMYFILRLLKEVSIDTKSINWIMKRKIGYGGFRLLL